MTFPDTASEEMAALTALTSTLSTCGTDLGTASASTGGSDHSDDESNREYVPGCFEGPEKTMEVVFRPEVGLPGGLRLLSRPQLDLLCTQAKCTILSNMSNNHMDAYVLSESSLFVYKHRFIMKTCGTTTLLRCLSSLLEFADELGMELTWVGYSRKNLMFPNAQLWPHSNFGDELKYLSTHEKLQDRLRGAGHILGPVTGDHWFVYVADHDPTITPVPATVPAPVSALGLAASSADTWTPPVSVPLIRSSSAANLSLFQPQGAPPTERTINMMMFDMAPDVASLFFQKNCATGKIMTARSGICNLVPGAMIDETAFTPCGYSMNAILHDAYSTIHITPEQECSYCSFETNTCLRSYDAMVRNVLAVFKPKRFVLTMFGDEAAFDKSQVPEMPTNAKRIEVPSFGSFSRTSLSSTRVETDLCCFMACYTMDASSILASSASHSSMAAAAAGVPRDRGMSLC